MSSLSDAYDSVINPFQSVCYGRLGEGVCVLAQYCQGKPILAEGRHFWRAKRQKRSRLRPNRGLERPPEMGG